jgi:hypothetical protein
LEDITSRPSLELCGDPCRQATVPHVLVQALPNTSLFRCKSRGARERGARPVCNPRRTRPLLSKAPIRHPRPLPRLRYSPSHTRCMARNQASTGPRARRHHSALQALRRQRLHRPTRRPVHQMPAQPKAHRRTRTPLPRRSRVTNVRTFPPQKQLPGAYSYARMHDTCPNCQAAPGDWCRRPDGHYRRCPCLARMTNCATPLNNYRHFSEPLTETP